jgi:hypothetical protein
MKTTQQFSVNMGSAYYTPAPWSYTMRLVHIEGLGDATQVRFYDASGGQLDMSEANARLIAAAPELLEQLERMLNIASGSTENRKTYAEAFTLTREIIKKAKGD